MSLEIPRRKIAIVGTGISALVAAHRLRDHHDLTLFEKNDYIGGHTQTHDIELDGQHYAIDTGFIVYNDWTYPEFIRLMETLGVASQASSMSFSVACEKTGLEYNGTTLNTLFAQRRNLISPRFHGMIRDILRFNREAPGFLESGDDALTLGEYIHQGSYGVAFKDQYIIPMGAAIWSAAPDDMLAFPARFFIRFFKNHGMLSVDQRPTWRVIKGGSSQYIPAMTEGFKAHIRLKSPALGVVRHPDRVEIESRENGIETFDHVIFACHSDEALALLKDASGTEKAVLGAIHYQENETLLHTDARILPKRRLAWAAWNYHIPAQASDRVAVTYNMNILQGLTAPHTFCVTLNHERSIDPSKILRRITYHHPAYTAKTIEAQSRHGEISGIARTHFAGAYWGFGFHEDGVKSGLRVANAILDNSV